MAKITEVKTRRDLRRFINFPYRHYKGDPFWVPPLRRSVKRLLTNHPFHKVALCRYFLAEENGQTVGRIAAIYNRRYNDFHGVQVGFFGFFECVDDKEVARSLIGAVEEALKEHRVTEIIGPASPSSNGEFGLLVQGFESTPYFLMPYNKRYYQELLEESGFEKVKDLYAYEITRETLNPRGLELIERVAGRVQNLQIRRLEMKKFEEELQAILKVYHRAWERNWGFDPLSEEEFRFEAAELKKVADSSLCFIAEVEGEPVAFALSLPDLNLALRACGGRLFPFGVFRFLRALKNTDRFRTLLLGIVEGWRGRGLDALLYWKTFQSGMKAGYRACECSWILEDNLRMRKAIERLGGEIARVYRVYRRPC